MHTTWSVSTRHLPLLHFSTRKIKFHKKMLKEIFLKIQQSILQRPNTSATSCTYQPSPLSVSGARLWRRTSTKSGASSKKKVAQKCSKKISPRSQRKSSAYWSFLLVLTKAPTLTPSWPSKRRGCCWILFHSREREKLPKPFYFSTQNLDFTSCFVLQYNWQNYC